MRAFDQIFTRRTLLIWLTTFFAPTVYFGLLAFGGSIHLRVGDWFLAALIYGVPFMALVVCLCIVLFSKATVGQKTSWIFFTLLAMGFQLAALLAAIFFTMDLKEFTNWMPNKLIEATAIAGVGARHGHRFQFCYRG